MTAARNLRQSRPVVPLRCAGRRSAMSTSHRIDVGSESAEDRRMSTNPYGRSTNIAVWIIALVVAGPVILCCLAMLFCGGGTGVLGVLGSVFGD